MLLKVTEVILSLFHAVISPAYRRKDSRDRGISNRCDDDGPYSLSYPSNCLVYPNKLFGIPNFYPGKVSKVQGGSYGILN